MGTTQIVQMIERFLRFDDWAKDNSFGSMEFHDLGPGMINYFVPSSDEIILQDDWKYFHWNHRLYFRTEEDMLLFKLQYC